MFPALLILLSTTSFVPIDDFAELDAVAGPADFGFLLIMSEDSIANKAMALEIVRLLKFWIQRTAHGFPCTLSP